MEIGDEDATGDALAYRFGDSVSFISHHDNAFTGKGLVIDVVAIEQCAIDWECFRKAVEKLWEVCIDDG